MANATATFHAGDGNASKVRQAPRFDRGDRRRRPPQLRKGTLHRVRLLRRLMQAADVPLALVVAPAGYGKTTLLAHAVQRDSRAVAWLSLDEGHDDAALLVTDIALALDI